MPAPRVRGAASYFPSIESKYGHPMEYWFAVLRKLEDARHMEMVEHLKTRHGMGHGHANAAVAAFLSSLEK